MALAAAASAGSSSISVSRADRDLSTGTTWVRAISLRQACFSESNPAGMYPSINKKLERIFPGASWMIDCCRIRVAPTALMTP